MFPFEFRRSQTSIPVCVFALSLFQIFEISFPWFTGSKSAFWAWMLWSWGGGRGLLTMAGGEPDMLTIAGEEPDFVSVLSGRGSTIDAGSAGAIVRLGGCNEFKHHVIEHDDVDFSSVLWSYQYQEHQEILYRLYQYRLSSGRQSRHAGTARPTGHFRSLWPCAHWRRRKHLQ